MCAMCVCEMSVPLGPLIREVRVVGEVLRLQITDTVTWYW